MRRVALSELQALQSSASARLGAFGSLLGDKAAEAADCGTLSEELAKAEPRNSEVREYIEVKLREAGC